MGINEGHETTEDLPNPASKKWVEQLNGKTTSFKAVRGARFPGMTGTRVAMAA